MRDTARCPSAQTRPSSQRRRGGRPTDPVACRPDRRATGPTDLVEFMLGTRRTHRRSLRDPRGNTRPKGGHGAHQRHSRPRQRHRVADPATDQDRRIRTDPAPPTTLIADAQAAKAGRLPAPGPAGVIFTSPTGLIHDPSNTQADLRQALDRAGYPWVSSHAFLKTVASRLDDEGYGIRHITDQLGHSRPSTTMDYSRDSPYIVGPPGLEPGTYGLKVDQAPSTLASLADSIGVFSVVASLNHSGRRRFMSRFMSRALPQQNRSTPACLAVDVDTSSALKASHGGDRVRRLLVRSRGPRG
jgi:hypothetical protein